jgi:hypothetical protein
MGPNPHIVGFTTIAIVCSLLLQTRFAKRTKLLSKALCWIILPALIAFARRFNFFTKPDNTYEKYQTTPRWPVWVTAIGIAVAGLCKAEAEVAWILVSNRTNTIPSVPRKSDRHASSRRGMEIGKE